MTESGPGRDTATFCATLADEWVRGGVRHALIAPGSRSTPISVALARQPGLRVHVVLDERSAGFMAVGIGRATGHPAVVVTTSGTAAVELHPAVVEAHHDGVPLICATADRPPELQGVGAPQTVDQVGLFGGAVRWSAVPGPPDAASAHSWRSLAARSVHEARGAGGRSPGPVHLNLAFREPLLAEPDPLPAPRRDDAPWHGRATGDGRLSDSQLSALAARVAVADGVIVAGAGAGDPADVHGLAAALDWPVLADPRSGARIPAATTVAYFDAILRAKGFAAGHAPAVVLRLGRLPASKVLGQWLAATAPVDIVVSADGSWVDPDRSASTFVHADPSDTCRRLAAAVAATAQVPGGSSWLADWQRAEQAAGHAIEVVLAETSPTEPGTARAALAAVPVGGSLVVSSSMPVRDVEWFGAPRGEVCVVANRGANGIDGVTSTAVGVALGSGRPVVLLIGDLAFLHDSNGLLGAVERGIDLTIVVVDNRGGGIFSFLPQRQQLATDEFEALFGTPQAVDLAALAGAHGIGVAPSIEAGVAAGGVRLVVVRTDRAGNVELHDRIGEAVVRAIDG